MWGSKNPLNTSYLVDNTLVVKYEYSIVNKVSCSYTANCLRSAFGKLTIDIRRELLTFDYRLLFWKQPLKL